MGMENNKPYEYKYIEDVEQRKLLFERMESVVENVIDNKIDNIIFLDKSARPLSVLFRNLYKLKTKLPLPKINYINIGREKKNLHKSGELLRLLDSSDETERIRKKYKWLKEAAGKKALIIDELESSGQTREMALSVMGHIFPQVSFDFFALAKNSDEEELFKRHRGVITLDTQGMGWYGGGSRKKEMMSHWTRNQETQGVPDKVLVGVIESRKGDIGLISEPFYKDEEYQEIRKDSQKLAKEYASSVDEFEKIRKEFIEELNKTKVEHKDFTGIYNTIDRIIYFVSQKAHNYERLVKIEGEWEKLKVEFGKHNLKIDEKKYSKYFESALFLIYETRFTYVRKCMLDLVRDLQNIIKEYG